MSAFFLSTFKNNFGQEINHTFFTLDLYYSQCTMWLNLCESFEIVFFFILFLYVLIVLNTPLFNIFVLFTFVTSLFYYIISSYANVYLCLIMSFELSKRRFLIATVFSFTCKLKLIFIWKDEQQDSLWKRGLANLIRKWPICRSFPV